jgi:hypothetical protein
MTPPPAAATFNGFDTARQAWHLLMNHRGVLLVAGAAGIILLVLPAMLALIFAVALLPIVILVAASEELATVVGGTVGVIAMTAGMLFVVGATMAAQVIAVSRAAEGLDVDVGDTLNAALRRAPRLLPLMLSVALIVFVGFMALMVPGFIAIACLFVALPAAVLEDRGTADSLTRSLALTRGDRWRLFSPWFGIGLVVSICAAMVEAILTALGFSLTFALLQLVFFVLWNAWNANYVALTFLRLRSLKD